MSPTNRIFWLVLGIVCIAAGLFTESDHGHLSVVGAIACATYAILLKMDEMK